MIMARNLFFIFILIFTSGINGCKKGEPNKVDIDQIDVDNSNNYRYMFREELQKEAAEKRKAERSRFKD